MPAGCSTSILPAVRPAEKPICKRGLRAQHFCITRAQQLHLLLVIPALHSRPPVPRCLVRPAQPFDHTHLPLLWSGEVKPAVMRGMLQPGSMALLSS